MHRFLVALALALTALPGVSVQQPPRTPVLVELFTSEGCSSCPPADALLSRLQTAQPIDGTQVIALEFHVDYWDRLGWKDPFSSQTSTKRQDDYSRIFGSDKIYTPQMVVNGEVELVGSDETLARAAIQAAAAKPHLQLRVSASARGEALRIAVDAPAAGADLEKTDIVVALVEDGLTSSVRRGENSGRTLEHSAVVRRHQVMGVLQRESFVGEGEWRLNSAWKPSHLRVIAFLQGQKTRRVYGAAAAQLQ
jgi:hypothetical protein